MLSMSLPARLPVRLITFNLLKREARRLVQIMSIHEQLLASWLVCSTPDRAVLVRALTLCNVLGKDTLLSKCLSPPRCTNGCRRMLGVTLRWTSIPSTESRNPPSRFILQKLGQASAWWAFSSSHADLTFTFALWERGRFGSIHRLP